MDNLIAVAALAFAGFLGIRSTFRLWGIVRHDAETRRDPILVLLASISTIITVAALWFGIMVVRRALGFDALPLAITIPVGLVLSALILLIPPAIERIVTLIGRGPRPADHEAMMAGRDPLEPHDPSQYQP